MKLGFASMLICLTFAGCGGTDSGTAGSPTTPSSGLVPYNGDLTGSWAGTSTLAKLSGGECVGTRISSGPQSVFYGWGVGKFNGAWRVVTGLNRVGVVGVASYTGSTQGSSLPLRG